MAKIVKILLAIMIMIMAAISLTPGRGVSKPAGRQLNDDLITSVNPSLAKNESEKRILSVLDELSQGRCVDELHGRLLRILAESTKAKNVVEIGTGAGSRVFGYVWALRLLEED
jgi:hypothetical protein